MNGPRAERRNRERLPLRLPLRLNRIQGPGIFTSCTENISSDGFCCILPDRLEIGEQVQVRVLLFTSPSAGRDHPISLCCLARVVRIEALLAERKFVVGCHIDRYSLNQDE